MPQATFNGDTLTVGIPSTGADPIIMDAQEDFYEPWKDFLRQGATAGNGTNKKYPQCFRPIAGDDIVPGQFQYAGLFFLQNQKGWRFQLPDEDVTLILTGNMALEDSALPFFRTRSGRTGAILGLANFVTAISKVASDVQELWQLSGLDLSNPMTVTPTSRDAGDISQVISGGGVATSTVTRQ